MLLLPTIALKQKMFYMASIKSITNLEGWELTMVLPPLAFKGLKQVNLHIIIYTIYIYSLNLKYLMSKIKSICKKSTNKIKNTSHSSFFIHFILSLLWIGNCYISTCTTKLFCNDFWLKWHFCFSRIIKLVIIEKLALGRIR